MKHFKHFVQAALLAIFILACFQLALNIAATCHNVAPVREVPAGKPVPDTDVKSNDTTQFNVFGLKKQQG